MEQQNKSSIGSIIGTIIIIAMIVLGGLYFWGKRIEDSKLKQKLVSDTTEQGIGDNQANVINSASTTIKAEVK